MFSEQQNNPLVVGYVDSNYARDLDGRRSTIGYIFTIAGGPIYWRSMIQYYLFCKEPIILRNWFHLVN